MADNKKMSVEDILAACRKVDSGGKLPTEAASAADAGAPDAPGDAGAEQSPSEDAGAATSEPVKKSGPMSTADILAAARAGKSAGKPAAAKGGSDKPAAASGAGPAKKPGEMSVADILAAARAEKSKGGGEAAAKPVAKAAPKPKPAAAGKPVAEKSVAEKPGAGGPKDTASILAAARKSSKPGPVSATATGVAKPEAAASRTARAKVEVPPMPAKPDYARPAAARGAAQEPARRSFLAAFLGVLVASPLAIGFSSLAVTHLLWVLGLARFMFPNILTEPPTRFKVGFPDEFAPGQVQTKFKAQFGVWVVRYEYEGEPQIFALKSVCTHLGCTPNWLDGEQKFKCPCHGSGFYKDGVNFEGPAPRPLERYAILLADDGQLEVDKSRKFQQELGQWSDPSSFVPV
jgi:cytochrome b6-f complex iron-sulfur subunit